MSDGLFAGSAAAAFMAGVVAFFAPCCAGVMLPSYLGAVAGGSRWRVARLTALYVAGVAAVVWPITLGASALAATVTRWHSLLFLVGGLLMLGVAVVLYRGTMWSFPLPQPRLTGSAASVFALGAFSGAATACCAPVLAGAVALSAVSASWAGGALLGGAYILGLVAPLLAVALAFGKARRRVRDPRLVLRLGGYVKSTTLSRLVGSIVLAGFGVLLIVLALTGRSETAPGFQQTFGAWIRGVAVRLDDVPNSIAWPILGAFALFLLYRVLRPQGERSS
ncbi:MAG TPA: cytochrome c biogenesis protein CcdA [Gaiellaceae bacterium]|nr:cytochrome c biogenesis protein CcdA [Gaiellaceae bacterium]